MSFNTDLRAFLLTKAAISAITGADPGARIHQNHVPETFAGTYLWLGRAGIGRADHLDMTEADNVDPWEQRMDVEAIGESQAESQALAAAVAGLHGARGAFGSGTVQAIFCEDQIDGYVPRGIMADTGLEVGALVLQVYGYIP